MALSPQRSEEIRERIEDLDLNDPHDRQTYEDARYEYIGAGEGKRPEAYDDGRGNTTVGVGFDMDRQGARKEWDDAFSKLPPDQRPDFDKVYLAHGGR